MKNIFALLSALIFATTIFAQSSATIATIAIIPEPVSITKGSGTFLLPQNVIIEAPSSPEIKNITDFLQKKFSIATGYKISVRSIAPTATIKLLLYKQPNKILGKEGYQLSVSPKGIVINANEAAGLFYAVQTLVQLFPKEIESVVRIQNIKWVAPVVEITDYPRFGWRGLMFDVSRHFFTKEEVKKYIDDMVRYKFNILHLGLTNDEGWRIEIKSLPKLTSVGA